MIPSSGFDSVPSDLAVSLVVETLAAQASSPKPGRIVSSCKLSGGVSGGTFASALEMYSKPRETLMEVAKNPYVLSPIRGKDRRRTRLVENIDEGYGAIFPLGGCLPCQGMALNFRQGCTTSELSIEPGV